MPPAAMRKAVERAREYAHEQTEPEQHQSSTDYAIERTLELAKDTLRTAGDGVQEAVSEGLSVPNSLRHAWQAAQQRFVRQRQTAQYSEHASAEQAASQPSQRAARRSAARQAQTATSEARRVAVKEAGRETKTPKQATKHVVKNAKAVKVVKAAPTAASSNVLHTAQSGAQGTQAATRAMIQRANAAAKAAGNAAKAIGRAAVEIAKAVGAAAKSLIAALSAGGGVMILVIIAVGGIAAILCSAFGVFFSDEADPGALKQAIIDINTDFSGDLQARIDSLSAGGYDAVNVIYGGDFDGDSLMVNNWTDVLGVYAVKTTTDRENGDEVLTLTPKKQALLKAIFNDMNVVNIRTETESYTSTTVIDGEEITETTTILNIFIDIRSLTYLEGAALYAFDSDQLVMLDELMAPEYYSFFAELVNVDIYGGLNIGGLANLVNDLPIGTKGGIIAQAAIGRVGTPYSKLDCSDLSEYAYAQAGVSIPGTSVSQAKFCYDNGYTISASQLQPGDLIFWSKTSCRCGRWNEIHHVAVYIGGGKIVDASSKNGRVVLRDLWNGDAWQIVLYARPHV